MRYITYCEYKNIGGVLNEAAFNRNVDRACGVLDKYTYGRCRELSEIDIKIKALCRDLIEFLHTRNRSEEMMISSESQSAGSVSESISYNSRSVEDVEQSMVSLITEYLSTETDDVGTPLLYKGCKI